MMLELNWYVVFCLVFLLDMNIKFVCSEKEDLRFLCIYHSCSRVSLDRLRSLSSGRSGRYLRNVAPHSRKKHSSCREKDF